MGVAAADFDNDGWTDLYVTGVNRNILYHNNGDGTFTDVTDHAALSGVDGNGRKLWSVGAAWFRLQQRRTARSVCNKLLGSHPSCS